MPNNTLDAPLAPESGDARGGGRVAADRLEQQRARNDRDLAQLLGDDEPMLFIGDHQGRGEALPARDPANRLLQQAVMAEEAQQLFWVERTRHRPEPCARTAGQDDGVDHASSSWAQGTNVFDLRSCAADIHRFCTAANPASLRTRKA